MSVHSPEGGLIPTELVERLEVADRGSRELDGLVEVAIRDVQAARSGLKREHWAKWRSNRDGHISDGHTFYDSAPVTTSIDAALALAERVLPGWQWTLGGPREKIAKSDDGRPFASLVRAGPEVANEGFVTSPGNTPAVALCIAILKATAASSVGTKGEARSEPNTPGEGEGL